MDRLFPFLFVSYCTTVGILLSVMPWTAGWDRLLSHFPYPGVRFLAFPWARAVLCGFGVVHLVWVVHDFYVLMSPPTGPADTTDRRGPWR